MGYWYNGYYSGLLIRQIRVQIPGDPLTPHHTNRIRWPDFQSGDTGSSPVGVTFMDSWPTGRGSRLKPGEDSFDSNTVHLRAQGSCACVWFNYVRTV